MTKDEFVGAIVSGVDATTVRSMLQILDKPPGRRPAQRLVAASNWFKSLDDVGRLRVKEIIEMSIHHAIFGFLCVLDGVQVIEPPETRGRLTLIHSSKAGDTVLNDDMSEDLHDIYQSTRTDLE